MSGGGGDGGLQDCQTGFLRLSKSASMFEVLAVPWHFLTELSNGVGYLEC